MAWQTLSDNHVAHGFMVSSAYLMFEHGYDKRRIREDLTLAVFFC